MESGPHFSFFLVSEPGTVVRPSLQKMWRVDRTFLFLGGLNLEQVRELTENVEREEGDREIEQVLTYS